MLNLQFVCDSLPFGGVGQSGFGRYHGKYSFETFSHEKAILQRRFFPELEPRYPPWNNLKFQFIKLLYAFNYIGLLLLLLGLKKQQMKQAFKFGGRQHFFDELKYVCFTLLHKNKISNPVLVSFQHASHQLYLLYQAEDRQLLLLLLLGGLILFYQIKILNLSSIHEKNHQWAKKPQWVGQL